MRAVQAGHVRAWVRRLQCCGPPLASRSRHHPEYQGSLWERKCDGVRHARPCEAWSTCTARSFPVQQLTAGAQPAQPSAHKEALEVGHKALRQLAQLALVRLAIRPGAAGQQQLGRHTRARGGHLQVEHGQCAVLRLCQGAWKGAGEAGGIVSVWHDFCRGACRNLRLCTGRQSHLAQFAEERWPAFSQSLQPHLSEWRPPLLACTPAACGCPCQTCAGGGRRGG